MTYADPLTQHLYNTIILLTDDINADIELLEAHGQMIFHIHIDHKSAGRIIGKYGETIKSLRSVFYSLTMKAHQKRSHIIVETY